MSVISRGFIEVENIIVELIKRILGILLTKTLCATIPSRCPENHVSDHETGYPFSIHVCSCGSLIIKNLSTNFTGNKT